MSGPLSPGDGSASTAVLDRDRWLCRFRAAADAEATVRLVCFPHAGGSATTYLPFSRLLPSRVEVLAVQYPGRQERRREPFAGSVAELADSVAAVLRPLTDRPLALFGHSLGSLVAFETARRLQRDGLPAPVRLFVSGRVAPPVPRTITTHLLDDDRLAAKIAELGGTGPLLLADQELMAMALPVIRNDYRLAAEYTYRAGPPLDCPLTVLTGEQDRHVPRSDALAWHELTTAPAGLHSFPGGHFYLNEHAEVVCDTLAEVLP